MLADKDRIFTNLYGYQPWNLKAAQARGDWDKTKDLMTRGQDAIIGGIVVLGWALKIAFKLVGIAIVLGLAVLAYIFIQNMVGKGR